MYPKVAEGSQAIILVNGPSLHPNISGPPDDIDQHGPEVVFAMHSSPRACQCIRAAPKPE